MALTDKLTDIADAIRNKTETTEPMTLDEMPSKIESIETEPILQDKSIEITENGTQTITADEGYDGLSNVDVTVNVEGTGSGAVVVSNLLDTSDYSLGGWQINSDGSLSYQDSSDIYRFNKTISVTGGETLYLSKGLVLYFNLLDTTVSYNTTGDEIITVPTGATQMGVRTFAKDFDTFNSSDYIISRTPIAEDNVTTEEIYSTEEVKTNRTWIDNKPIYRKVFTGKMPDITNGTFSTLSFDISDLNLDSGVDWYGVVVQNNTEKTRWALDWCNFQTDYSSITAISGGLFKVQSNTNALSNATVHVVLEYTKTTD